MPTPRLILTLCVLVELAVFGCVIRNEAAPASAPYSRVVMVVAAPPKPEAAEPVAPAVHMPTFADHCPKTPPAKFDALLEAAAAEFKVDPRVLATTVYRESGCDEDAIGASGEIGLGQVLPQVWLPALVEAKVIKHMKDLWNPRANLRASAFILATLGEQAGGDLRETFRRYNGSGRKAHAYAREQVRAFSSLWGSGMARSK